MVTVNEIYSETQHEIDRIYGIKNRQTGSEINYKRINDKVTN